MSINQEIKVVVRFSHIGDIILLSGVLAWRHYAYNEKFIIITQKNMAEIFKNNPAVLEVVEIEKANLKGKNLRDKAKECAEKYPYPLYDLHATLRSKIFKYYWKEKTFTYPKDALARRIYLYSKKKIRSERLNLHVVERYALAFSNDIPLKTELMPNLFLDENEINFAQKFLSEKNSKNKKIIAIHPFATHKGKVWSEDNWKNLYQELSKEYFPLVIGVGQEYDWIASEHNALNKFSIRQSAALLHHAHTLITGDSAPLHLAMSVQTRVIALFGATAKEWGFYPLGTNDVFLQGTIPCSPCSLHGKVDNCPHAYACINEIKTNDILKNL